LKGPLPVAISRRLAPGSITAPARAQIAESVAGQLAGTISPARLAHRLLNTTRTRPLARSISSTWPW
jgi:hypothetical protein